MEKKHTQPDRLRHEVLIPTRHITDDDRRLLDDLNAVAHLTRTTPADVVAQIVKTTLGPTFAPLIKAA